MFKRRAFKIFIFAFIFAFIFQGLRWKEFRILDGSVWSDQAFYVQSGDVREFDFTKAYGHPGGTVIEGVSSLSNLFDPSRKHSTQILMLFLSFFNSLTIAGVCVLCYLLRKNDYWWIIALSILSLDRLYDFATPPTAIVTPLVVFLSLLTLYLYENKEKIHIRHILCWSLVAGLSIATRFDIGIFCASSLGLFLVFKKVINLRNIFFAVGGTLASFVLFDPFMWFMPVQHIKDLIYKIIFHYAEYTPTHLSFSNVFYFSVLAFIGVILSIMILFSKKKIKSPLPLDFTIILLSMTSVLYVIFLTAHYQAQRYFQPIISIWEMFLPILIFAFLPKIFPAYSTEKKQKITAFFFVVFSVCVFFLNYIILPVLVLPVYLYYR